jgi:hypothetical protein
LPLADRENPDLGGEAFYLRYTSVASHEDETMTGHRLDGCTAAGRQIIVSGQAVR